MTQLIEVNGVRLWHELSGEGEPVLQIHGGGFNHYNFEPVTPVLNQHFTVIDYDQRGYGLSERPRQDYDMETWADDAVTLLDMLGIERAHVHGTSMGGMIAIVVAGKYPDRVRSVVINCAAAKLGTAARLAFKNRIDLARLDASGPASRLFAEVAIWQARSKAFLAEHAEEAIENLMRVFREVNDTEVFIRGYQAMIDMDLTGWLALISAPALVIGGDEDFIMTPWDQGPDGAGMDTIHSTIPGAEKHVVPNASHTTIFDNPDDYTAAVLDFLLRHRDVREERS